MNYLELQSGGMKVLSPIPLEQENSLLWSLSCELRMLAVPFASIY